MSLSRARRVHIVRVPIVLQDSSGQVNGGKNKSWPELESLHA